MTGKYGRPYWLTIVICAISCASEILEIAGVARSPSRTSRRRCMLIFLPTCEGQKLKLTETRWRSDVNAARNLGPAFVRERKPAEAAARIVHRRSIVGALTVGIAPKSFKRIALIYAPVCGMLLLRKKDRISR